MKSSRPTLASHAALLALLAQGPDPIPPATPAVWARVDSIFADANAPDRPGYAVGIIRDGAVVYRKGFGSANVERRLPITPASVFNVASLAKQFTGTCVAILVLRRQVHLDAPVQRYIPEFPARFGAVTVAHLVYMTSGLPEYYSRPRPGGASWADDPFTVADAIAAVLAAPALDFEPGSRWAYSNVNYMLLAEIVSRVSGTPFATFAQREVFQPLGMEHTLVHDNLALVIPGLVTGYNLRTEGGYRQETRRSPHYGGSGVFTSVDDLVRWDRNLASHQLGGRELTNLLLSTRRFAHDKVNDAFGIVWGEYRGRRTLWYEGGDLGFSSYMVRLPDDHVTVIVLSNLGTGQAAVRARRVLDVLFDVR